MTPAARIEAAITLLTLCEETRRPADRVVRDFFKARRYAGSKDRRAVIGRFYAVVRHRARLQWWVERAAPDLAVTPRHWVIADLVLGDNAQPAADIEALFDGGKFSAAALTAEDRALVAHLEGQSLDHPDQPRFVRLELPLALSRVIGDSLGADIVRQMAALNTDAPVDLRVNSLKTTREAARALLGAADIEAAPTPLSPLGLRLAARPRLDDLPAYRDGLIEVQDEGAQVTALLTDARPGMTVIDYCAGAGGKTLALGAEMRAQGRLIACDIDAERLKRMAPRLKRAGLDGIEGVDLGPGPEAIAGLDGQADRVLVDAPCTGTGVWRRAPEARWRLRSEDIARALERQRAVLDAAQALVKPGGRLIYVTCSLLKSENEDQVMAFLDRHDDFILLPIANVWREVFDTPCPTNVYTLRLNSADHGTDGFYCAVLQRD
ncbi:RsmB/NOP family class I SAM-dependent RNA methyltransferase [Varunaivibrio sulfuroxidans]|uniref:16S rRNA (Cytosine967-C5)-methyltransferase n=1 Tax=Varunaivibrio sulfuroxidans TaxID=1773489 RepID=A0A4R3JBF9_9PROT|nr:RsmB/NOP family class I SAM-dependent RNA methyltransferase [Varunaivibrio sulfuroxidans]TCS62964.1 16S rRNA (cytosine967-C5)-methyltransferase [Varunaivibrio sulfuroxidans]WES31958.1 RsmB/NOP family class I SAM-dependent RNA methyltransferase [Varunaivibrio sulfuroxidans]